MPLTDAKRRANTKWDAANMTVLGCKVRKEKAEEFKAQCRAAGITPNALFIETMERFMAENGSDERISLLIPKNQRDVIQAHATAVGLSVNAYIMAAIAERMERDNAAPAAGEKEVV